MRGLSVHLSHVALCVGFFAAAQTFPPPGDAGARAVEAAPVQVSRLAERVGVERALASARPPVPWIRGYPLEPYVPPKEPEPTVAVVAPPPIAASVDPTGRMTTEARWHAVAARGSTQLAVTATP